MGFREDEFLALYTEIVTRLLPQPTPWLLVIRWIGLLGLLTLEVLGLTWRFDTQTLTDTPHGWAVWLGHTPALLNISLASVVAFLLFVGARAPTALQALLQQYPQHRWRACLVLHFVAFSIFVYVTARLFIVAPEVVQHPSPWLMVWTISGASTLLLWCFALAPVHCWRHLLQQTSWGLLWASLFGVGAWASGQLMYAFWSSLTAVTFWCVRHLLGLLYADIVYQTAQNVLGTPTFRVAIAPTCAGYEGIGLITLLLILYLYLFRDNLRFPQAFLLLPIGALGIWMANVVRLTTLIAIGTSVSRAVAVGGFHSQAGWIAFLLVGLGIITVTHRRQWFALPTTASLTTEGPSWVAAMLVPLLALLATSLVTSAVSSGFDWLYPLRVVVTSAALWSCRKVYLQLTWTWCWPAGAIGAVVFALWLLLAPAAESQATALADGLAQLSGGWASVWVGFRVIGAVMTVPVAEELACRGYVIRQLVARDAEHVRPGQFTWWSFLGSSVLFGVLHDRWCAGTLAGMGYAFALYRRGQLADAVVAHMTTNALLSFYILCTHEWSHW
jgi:exosortase E/protease (VPEID-CTERM system)